MKNVFGRIETLAKSCNSILLKIYSFLENSLARKIIFFSVIVISFAAIYLLNRLHPLYGDDWMYSMLPEPSNEHVRSFKDILYTQYKHYFTWGGRSVVHVIAQVLLFSGEFWGDLFNSMAYVALTLVIYFFANKGNKTNPALLIIINLLICFFQPAFGSTMLWITGSANYLWGTLIVVSFLLPYRFYMLKDSHDNYLKVVAFFFFGVIAGWTNENMGVALVCIIFLFICYYKYQNKSIPRWAISGLIGATLGCVLMIAAPGNYARMNATLAQEGANGMGLMVYAARFFASIASFYYYCLGLAFIFFIVVVIAKNYTRKESPKAEKTISYILFAGAVIATLAMSASPLFPGRAAYGINTLIILSIALLCANLDFKNLFVKNLTFIAVLFGLLFYSADYYRGCRELAEAKTVLDNRQLFLEQEKRAGKKYIEFDRLVKDPETRYFHYFEIGTTASDWQNRMYSRYYEIDSVKAVR